MRRKKVGSGRPPESHRCTKKLDGKRCGHWAEEGSDRCRHHPRDAARKWRQCTQILYPSGERCRGDCMKGSDRCRLHQRLGDADSKPAKSSKPTS